MIVLYWIAPLAIIFVPLFILGVGYLVANRIRADVLRPEVNVTSAGVPAKVVERIGGRVVFDTGDWAVPRGAGNHGTWGVVWKRGYGQVSAITGSSLTSATGTFRHMMGDQLGIGEEIAIDKFAFPRDPKVGLSIDFEEVIFQSPAGRFPAWLTKGQRNTWVIFVHGHRAPRREVLRALRPASTLQLSTLVICYRNDPEMLDGKADYYRFGSSEWEDLESAVRYAIDFGASGVILVGFSMGGAIVANFVGKSQLAHHVAGIVLDSPTLDLHAMVRSAVHDKRILGIGVHVPRLSARIAAAILALRYNLDLKSANNFLDRDFETPIMLFHGTMDEWVPVAVSDSLARALPGLVTYRRVEGARHVESWNINPAAYEGMLTWFLDKHAD